MTAALILSFGLGALSQTSQPAAPAAPSSQKAPSKQGNPTNQGQQGQKAPAVGQLRREVRLVNVVFSVLDKKNHFVTDLGQKNFEVFDDDVPQHVEFFSRETDLPLRIGLLIDTSNSIRSRLQFEQSAAFDFLYRTIRPDRDLAFLMTFDTHPVVQQGFTDKLNLLRQAINEQRAGGGTALYDAIYSASQSYLMNPPPPSSGNNMRRVLVVISDGLDDLSNHARSDAINEAERAGIVIYTISTSRKWISPDQEIAGGMPLKFFYTAGDKVLQEFSNDTGGRTFYPYRVEDLEKAFADIDAELRSQYSIAYTPSSHPDDGKFHRIHIEIVDRGGLNVRARQGYWAPSSTPSPAAKPQG